MKFYPGEPDETILRKVMSLCIVKDNGCVEFHKLSRAGYGYIFLENKNWYVHRLVFAIHNPKKFNESMMICHKCDNPACCNIDHLFQGSQADNMQDAKRKGRLWKSGSIHD